MEASILFETRASPDRVLAELRSRLESEGFDTRGVAAEDFDVQARRRVDRVFVGLAAHPDGLAARLKAKSLIPGRDEEVFLLARRGLEATLGRPRGAGEGSA